MIHLIKRLQGLRQLMVAPGQRAIVVHKGKFTEILGAGAHWVPNTYVDVMVHSLAMPLFSSAHQGEMVRTAPDIVAAHFETFDTSATEVAVVEVQGKTHMVVGAETRALLWKDAGPFTVTHFALDTVPSVDAKLAERLMRAGLGGHLTRVHVPEGAVGLLRVDGVAAGRLATGTHAFWKTEAALEAKLVDMRARAYDVTGQEILTKDRVSLRVNLSATYKVVDPELVLASVDDHKAALHLSLQLAFRKTLGAMTLDEMLTDKVAVDADAADTVRAEMASIGLEVGEIALKDVILPGDMRDLLNQVVAAQKEAEANVIRRREETNATRSLLNTAKVMAEHPAMMRLKELEVLESVAEKVEHLTVHNGTQGLMSDLVRLKD